MYNIRFERGTVPGTPFSIKSIPAVNILKECLRNAGNKENCLCNVNITIANGDVYPLRIVNIDDKTAPFLAKVEAVVLDVKGNDLTRVLLTIASDMMPSRKDEIIGHGRVISDETECPTLLEVASAAM